MSVSIKPSVLEAVDTADRLLQFGIISGIYSGHPKKTKIRKTCAILLFCLLRRTSISTGLSDATLLNLCYRDFRDLAFKILPGITREFEKLSPKDPWREENIYHLLYAFGYSSEDAEKLNITEFVKALKKRYKGVWNKYREALVDSLASLDLKQEDYVCELYVALWPNIDDNIVSNRELIKWAGGLDLLTFHSVVTDIGEKKFIPPIHALNGHSQNEFEEEVGDARNEYKHLCFGLRKRDPSFCRTIDQIMFKIMENPNEDPYRYGFGRTTIAQLFGVEKGVPERTKLSTSAVQAFARQLGNKMEEFLTLKFDG